MHIRWRIDKKGAIATATAVEDALSASPEPIPTAVSAEERKQRLLMYLRKNVAAAIAAEIWAESNPIEYPDKD